MTRDEVIQRFLGPRSKIKHQSGGNYVFAASDKVVLLFIDGRLDESTWLAAWGELEAMGLSNLKRTWYVNGLITYACYEDTYQRIDEDCPKLVGISQFRRAA